MRKLLLGVDGGNTKTDYFLFGDDGALVADARGGSVSHEVLGTFEAAGEALRRDVVSLCQKAEIIPQDIDAAVLGLAGVDIPSQYTGMSEQVEQLGMKRFVVCNDSLLGIKASAPQGYGICSINGTGVAVSGVDPSGALYQVGGIGDITSDYGGGGYLAREVVRRVYDEYCRDGASTSMTPIVSELLHIEGPATIMDAIHDTRLQLRSVEEKLCRLLFASAAKGDAVALDIIMAMADRQAASVAGCCKNLHFPADAPLPVILAGSIWAKSGYPPLLERFQASLEARIGRTVQLILLTEPPALGAILWAGELANESRPGENFRGTVVSAIRAARA